MVTRAPAVGARRWWYWPWHSLLVAAFPVLFLFAQNTADQVTLEPLWTPLAVCLIGAVLLLLVCFAFRRDWARAGLMATSLLALFFTYGHVWNLLDDSFLTQQWPLIVIWIVGALILVSIAWRGGPWVRTATQVLNVALGALVVFKAFADPPQDWLDIEGIVVKSGRLIDWTQVRRELSALLELKGDSAALERLERLIDPALPR